MCSPTVFGFSIVFDSLSLLEICQGIDFDFVSKDLAVFSFQPVGGFFFYFFSNFLVRVMG